MAKSAYHHGNLKPALIAAALKEIAHEGPEKFSLRGVARRAGVSAPAVYRHFKDKDDLLAAVAADCYERFGDAIVASAEQAPPDDPLEQFRATGIAVVQFAVAHPEHYRAMNAPGLYERMPAEQRAAQEGFVAAQRESLAAAQAAGKIANLPLDDILLTATTAITGLAHAIIEGRLGDVDAKRATQLATAVTKVLGVGFWPREKNPIDPREPKPRKR
ncbi:MAG: TetR/AcrR family transcriptional regulator [Deltaproteobacteria bacterium]|nr:TetR/AcrR family transcriptional regulator [Deltaproteobacteria bacterium]